MAGEKINSTLLIVCLFAILLPTTASDCPAYDCKLSDMKWNSNYCAYHNKTTDTIYSSEVCKKTESCVEKSGSDYYECQPIAPTNTTVTIFPGEKCGLNLFCPQNSNCTTGDICAGIQQGQSCDNDKEKFCDVGFYCDGTCKQVLLAGASCTDDNQCQIGMGCYLQKEKEGICKAYFSLDPGSEILEYNVDENDISDYCKHLYAFQSPTNPAVFLCAEPLVNAQSLSANCTAGDKCLSKPNSVSNSTKEVDCVCGLNSKGNAYCQEFAGDKYSSKYQKLVRNWVGSSDQIKHCSEMTRTDFQLCAKDWSKDYDEAVYYYYRSVYAPLLYDAKSCVISNFREDFYLAKRTYEDGALILSAILYFLLY